MCVPVCWCVYVEHSEDTDGQWSGGCQPLHTAELRRTLHNGASGGTLSRETSWMALIAHPLDLHGGSDSFTVRAQGLYTCLGWE